MFINNEHKIYLNKMQLTTNQPDTILDTAIQIVGERTGLDLVAIEPELGPDLLIRINDAPAATEYRAEIKQYLNKQAVGLLAAKLAQNHIPIMLVADYVNRQQANRLRRLEIPFIDTAGNVYLNEPPVFVFATGSKPETLPTAKPRVRLFQPTGLKLIFALLNQPGLEQKPYREQAGVAGIALGAVAWIMRDLREGGYLITPTPGNRRLINKRALADLWVENYPARLRQKLLLGRYTTTRKRWWLDTDIAEHRGCWGGEIAADRLTHYLKPANATIYADKLPSRLLLENRLHNAPNGDIEILRRFWRFDYEAKAMQVVPPLLVNADLIATGEGRNIEVARMVYDEHVARYLAED